MARQIRKKSGTGIYHIMLRGIPLMIQSLEKVRRNEILITAKAMGAGLRQLSRLTGVSFGVIQKLGDDRDSPVTSCCQHPSQELLHWNISRIEKDEG